MNNFKKWVPVYTDSEAERQTMVLAVIQELEGQPPGTNSIYVGGDTLVYGCVTETGEPHIYDTKIRASNQDSQDLQDEGNAVLLTKGNQVC